VIFLALLGCSPDSLHTLHYLVASSDVAFLEKYYSEIFRKISGKFSEGGKKS